MEIAGNATEAFLEYLDSGRIPLNDFPEFKAEFLEHFEESSDTLPQSYCDTIGIRPGSSYADAVHAIKHDG